MYREEKEMTEFRTRMEKVIDSDIAYIAKGKFEED